MSSANIETKTSDNLVKSKYNNQIPLLTNCPIDQIETKVNKIYEVTPTTTPFGRLCFAVLYHLIKSFIHNKKNYTFEVQSGIKTEFKLDLYKPSYILNYADNIMYKAEFKDGEYEDKVLETINSFKCFYHELFYGKMLNSDFNQRDNSPEFWLKNWKYSCSPFRIAQIILKQFNFYLVDNTVSDEKFDICVYLELPKLNNNLNVFHKNYLIPNVTKKDIEFRFKNILFQDRIINKFLKFSSFFLSNILYLKFYEKYRNLTIIKYYIDFDCEEVFPQFFGINELDPDYDD